MNQQNLECKMWAQCFLVNIQIFVCYVAIMEVIPVTFDVSNPASSWSWAGFQASTVCYKISRCPCSYRYWTLHFYISIHQSCYEFYVRFRDLGQNDTQTAIKKPLCSKPQADAHASWRKGRKGCEDLEKHLPQWQQLKPKLVSDDSVWVLMVFGMNWHQWHQRVYNYLEVVGLENSDIWIQIGVAAGRYHLFIDSIDRFGCSRQLKKKASSLFMCFQATKTPPCLRSCVYIQ